VLGPGPDKLTVMRSAARNTPSFRVFEVETGAVTIAGLTIRNGSAYSGTNIHDNVGGAILNRGMLTVSNCVITGNSALTTDWGTNFNPSVSLGFGAGVFSDTGSELALVNSTISGNHASAAGGAVCTHYADGFVAAGCTFSGNAADLQGGGLNFQGLTGRLQNCTLSGNSTPPDGAGSAFLLITFPGESATLTLTACTVAGNVGCTNGACILAAISGNSGLTNRLLSTLVAGNVGPTLTIALLPDSPALGTGACSDADGAPLTVDQRGLPRPQITGCDIGAFENQAPTLVCPVAQTLGGCGPHDGPFASLTATVADPDGDALVVIWSVNGIARQTNSVAATHPPKPKAVTFAGSFNPGTNIVNVLVSDGKAVPVACTTSVIERDRTPPRIISITASPNVLRPANGNLVPVTVVVQAVDDCGPVTSRIISVRSNEPPDGKQPDWVITGDLSLLLRAERSPHGHGRVYTITVRCSDASGNTSTGTVLVTVPRDGGH
jgi:hypothetical protein